MQPLQRLWDTQGNEVCLFPMQYMHVSNGEHHLYAIDFLGWNALGRVYDCPCYAPISCEVVYTGNDHNMICWSLNPVRLADGTLSNISILVAHSNTAPSSVGTTFVQGQLWYHTGNYVPNVTSFGDHLHLEIALGHVKWDSTGQHLENPGHLYNIMAVNDTVINAAGGYTWIEYQGGVTPGSDTPKKRFPWVLYARKFRNKRLS